MGMISESISVGKYNSEMFTDKHEFGTILAARYDFWVKFGWHDMLFGASLDGQHVFESVNLKWNRKTCIYDFYQKQLQTRSRGPLVRSMTLIAK